MLLVRNLLAIAAGGALGAVSRFVCSVAFVRILGANFPYGTLVVNALGSLLIGMSATFYAMKFGTTQPMALFIMTGFLGALTTFSSFSLETLNLFLKQQTFLAFLNISLNVLLSLLFVYLGMLLQGKLINV